MGERDWEKEYWEMKKEADLLSKRLEMANNHRDELEKVQEVMVAAGLIDRDKFEEARSLVQSFS